MINTQTDSRGKSTKVAQSQNGGGRGMTPVASHNGDGKGKGRKAGAPTASAADGQRTAGTGSSSSGPQHDEIAARAHQIYLKKGKPEGKDLENWLEAERELRAAR